MSEQPHVETTPEQGKPGEQQAADLAALQDMAGGGSSSEPAEQEGPRIPTAALLAPLVGLAFASLAPAWNVTEQEQAPLVEAYAAVVDKYFPDGINMGPELAALMVTAAIVMPRLQKPRYPQDEEKTGGDADH